ncbi:hypothetical protein NXY28_18160 [Bacteroides thetaiotaomicron]|nr:hypothetical protein NXY28_18160 [Bacteroides thetaiotaomicron]
MGKSRNRRNGASQGAPFLKCYSRMLGVFDPEEIVFMLYMADLSRLRGKGFDTLRSKRTHMANTGIGSRLFDRCVRRMTALGLLERCRSRACMTIFGTDRLMNASSRFSMHLRQPSMPGLSAGISLSRWREIFSPFQIKRLKNWERGCRCWCNASFVPWRLLQMFQSDCYKCINNTISI